MSRKNAGMRHYACIFFEAAGTFSIMPAECHVLACQKKMTHAGM
jgi:hypothetical protein